jgi:hypothetical protein
MSLSNVYTAGLNNVGSYQVSGIPFATGSLSAIDGTALEVTFPYVTQWITFVNHDSGGTNHLEVGFSSIGLAGSNSFRVGPQSGNEHTQNLTINVKVSSVFLTGSGDFDIVAGLTNIPIARVDNIGVSGSNWSGSVGVG